MKDTTPEVDAKFTQLLLDTSPAERIQMACSMFSLARTVVESSIRNEKPHYDELEMKIEIFTRFYGSDFEGPIRERILEYFVRELG